MVSNLQSRKVRLVLGYISQDLADCMALITRKAGMQVDCIHLSKNRNDFLQLALKADAVFVQWDGRANTGHEIISNWAQGNAAPRGSIYAVTTSKIRIDTLAAKPSKLLNISGWFDIPVETEKLNAELALLVPDVYDDFTVDLANSGLRMLAELPLPRLRGKHLIDEIKTAWDERAQKLSAVTRGTQSTFPKHILLYCVDQARSNELSTFLNENRFKYHAAFDQPAAALKFMRGHTTDAIVAWYDRNADSAELFLRMHLEQRGARRIPIIVVFPTDEDMRAFQERAPTVILDKAILFDRNRDKFRASIIDAFDILEHEKPPRKTLEDLRITAKESLDFKAVPLDALQLEIACTQLGSDPAKVYWADAERLYGYARLKDSAKFDTQLSYVAHTYKNFDARFNIAASRCLLLREDSATAIHGFVSRLAEIKDLSEDRLFRAGVFAAKSHYPEGIVPVIEFWWNTRQRWPLDHQFYFVAAKFCALKCLFALERSLLAMAIRQDPLRNDYVEAYCSHLAATNHHGHVIKLCDYLLTSDYFPRRRAVKILAQAHMKLQNNAAAIALIEEQLKVTPEDRSLAALRDKIQDPKSA